MLRESLWRLKANYPLRPNMEKRVGKYWVSYGRCGGFALGFNISKWSVGIDLGFWYIGLEF